MDRLWSNVARTGAPDFEQHATRGAEIVIDTRLEDARKEGVGLTLGCLVPDFMADSTQGKIDWHRWIGDSWAVLVGYPNDFRPVAATELAYLAQVRHEFEERGIKVAAVAGNSVDDHLEFVHDIESSDLPNGNPIAFPLMADPDRSIAETYGMLDMNVKDPTDLPKCSRGVFVVDSSKRLRFSMLYPTHTGCNLKEVLRVIDSIKLSARYGVWTTANWTPGDTCAIDPAYTDERIRDSHGKFKHYTTSSGRNYLRYVDDPSPSRKSGGSAIAVVRSILGVASGVLIGLVAGKFSKPLRSAA